MLAGIHLIRGTVGKKLSENEKGYEHAETT